MDPSSAQQPAVLEYAAAARQRRWWRRKRYIVLLMALAVAGAAYAYREQLSIRGRRLYWGWRCMNYVDATPAMIHLDPIDV